jgi:DNA replication protein DnaC
MQLLTHPMLDQLGQLGLSGMAQAFAELETSDETAALTHADWLGLLVDRELTHRRDKRLAARLRYARLRQPASVEDVDYRPGRAGAVNCRSLSQNEAVSPAEREVP